VSEEVPALSAARPGEPERLEARPLTASIGVGAAVLLVIAMATLFCAARLIQSSQGLSSGNYIDDETLYYRPAILQIRGTWPALSVTNDSLSATAPGYPWILAGASLVLGPSIETLRIINLAVGLLVLLVLGRSLSVSVGSRVAALLLLPLATSNYFLKSCCWIVTDNASLLFVVATVCVLLSSPGRMKPLLLGALVGAAVFVRQSNLWLVAPVAISVFTELDSHDTASSTVATRLWRVAVAITPAVTIFAWFFLSWGGLVPPRWTEKAQHMSLAPLVYLLALQGLLGLPFLAALTLSMPNRETRWRIVLVGAGIGVLLAVAGETSADYPSGRWGGYLWNVAAITPVVAGRSIFVTMMVALGGGCLGWFIDEFLRSRDRRSALLLGIIYLAFWISFLPNRQAFHRYFEPTLLVFLALACAQVLRDGVRLTRRSAAVLITLSILGLGVSSLVIFNSKLTHGMRPPGLTGR
jgi:hypothetical protein